MQVRETSCVVGKNASSAEFVGDVWFGEGAEAARADRHLVSNSETYPWSPSWNRKALAFFLRQWQAHRFMRAGNRGLL